MESSIHIELHRQRDFGTKINVTFEFIRENFRPLLTSLLYIAGPLILLGAIFISSFYRRMMNLVVGMQTNPDLSSFPVNSVGFWLEVITGFLFFFLGGLITVSVVYNYFVEYETAGGRRIEVTDIWKRVTSSFFLYLATFFLYYVLVIGVYLLLIVVASLLSQASTTVSAIFSIGYVIGMLWLLIVLSLLFFVRGYERKGFFESIGRCFFLVRGKWWSTFGLLFITTIIQVAIVWVLFFVLSLVISFFTSMLASETGRAADSSTSAQVVTGVILVVYLFINILLSLIPLTALAFQYFNLVELKEAAGLMSKIDQMGKGTPAPRKDEDY